EGERGGRIELAVVEHGGQERRALAGWRREVCGGQEDRDHDRQQTQQPDTDEGPRSPEQLAQLDPDHASPASRSPPDLASLSGRAWSAGTRSEPELVTSKTTSS